MDCLFSKLTILLYLSYSSLLHLCQVFHSSDGRKLAMYESPNLITFNNIELSKLLSEVFTIKILKHQLCWWYCLTWRILLHFPVIYHKLNPLSLKYTYLNVIIRLTAVVLWRVSLLYTVLNILCRFQFRKSKDKIYFFFCWYHYNLLSLYNIF